MTRRRRAHVGHADRGMEHDGAAGARRELRPRSFMRAGLADRPAVQFRDLIAADHECLGTIRGDCARLGFGEA